LLQLSVNTRFHHYTRRVKSSAMVFVPRSYDYSREVAIKCSSRPISNDHVKWIEIVTKGQLLLDSIVFSLSFMKDNNSEARIVGGTAVLFMTLAILFPSTMVIPSPHSAYAQVNATTDLTPNAAMSSQNTTVTGVTDFKTLRDQYLAQWQQLNFQSSFDTFVEPYSALGYGVYEERPSNIFTPDTSAFTLYVEPVGYGFKEGIDEEGNLLYSFNFTATIEITDSQGNPLTQQGYRSIYANNTNP
jgi:hypothetical protein